MDDEKNANHIKQTGSSTSTGRCGHWKPVSPRDWESWKSREYWEDWEDCALLLLVALGSRRLLRSLLLPRLCSRVASVQARRSVQVRIYFLSLCEKRVMIMLLMLREARGSRVAR